MDKVVLPGGQRDYSTVSQSYETQVFKDDTSRNEVGCSGIDEKKSKDPRRCWRTYWTDSDVRRLTEKEQANMRQVESSRIL